MGSPIDVRGIIQRIGLELFHSSRGCASVVEASTTILLICNWRLAFRAGLARRVMQVLFGSVGKEEDGDAEKGDRYPNGCSLSRRTSWERKLPASSLKLTRRRRLRGAIGRLEMQDNSNRMTNMKRKRKENLGGLRCKIEILALSLIEDEMKSRGKLGYCSKHLLHKLFGAFLCSANLRRWQGLQ
jgi:hypothetical protein